MKKSLTKIIASCAAVMAVATAMAVSASAADYAEGKATNVDITVPTAAGVQTTILVYKAGDTAGAEITSDDIKYINQGTKEEIEAIIAAGIPVGILDETAEADKGTYVIKVGGEGVTAIADDDFTIGKAPAELVKLGNVIGEDAEVDGTDALVILRYSVKNESAMNIINTPKQIFIANINGDKTTEGTANVDGTDALIALRASVKNEAAMGFIKEVEYIAE